MTELAVLHEREVANLAGVVVLFAELREPLWKLLGRRRPERSSSSIFLPRWCHRRLPSPPDALFLFQYGTVAPADVRCADPLSVQGSVLMER